MNKIISFMMSVYMENYKPLTEKHSWPLYNMDIARTAMAAKIMMDRNNSEF